MKMSCRITMLLLDMKPHKLGEFGDYLMGSIDPAISVRRYLQRTRAARFKGVGSIPSTTIDHQIKSGARVVILGSVRKLSKDGDIHLFEHDDTLKWEEATVQLTEQGLEKLRRDRNLMGSVVNEMRRLFELGKGHIQFIPEGIKDENYSMQSE